MNAKGKTGRIAAYLGGPLEFVALFRTEAEISDGPTSAQVYASLDLASSASISIGMSFSIVRHSSSGSIDQ